MTANDRTVRRKWVQKVLMIISLACIIILVAWGAHIAYHAFSRWRIEKTDVSECHGEHEGVCVICPAVQAADRQRTCDPFEPTLQPELVVSGKITETKDRDGSTSVFTVQVEDVIYGSWPKATLQFEHYHISSKKERLIFTFVPKVYRYEGGGQFDLKATFDVSESEAVRALCDARLDYNTLVSQCIFVGKEIRYKGDYIRQVEVIRPLSGSAPKKGERIDVRFMGYMQQDNDRLILHSQLEIYFIVDISREKNQPPIYELSTRQPADQDKKVLAALARKGEYPVREEKDGGGETHKYREVMFRGSLDEAVKMLGSTSEGASTLAARLLLYKSDAACPLIVSAIEKKMFEFVKPEYRRYRHLNLLVKLLGAMDDEESEIALGRLIDRTIAYIESGKPPPPTVPEGLSYKREEHKEWANHILAWLLMQLDEKSVAAKYGKPLLKLRDKVTGQWKREVQLALDACRVEDIFELQVAYSRASKIKTCARHSGQIAAIYFQPDGRTIRSVGYDNTVCLMDAATLKVTKRISPPKGYKFISARPGDGRYALFALPEKSRSLYMDPLTGSESKLPAIKIVDLVTGKTVSRLEMYIPWNYTATRLIWLDDKEALCMADGTWRRFNYLTGEILDTREIDISAQNTLFNGRGELTEDGKKLFLWSRSGGKGISSEIKVWTVDVKTVKASKKTMSRQNICGGYNRRGLVPGGKYFYVADPDMYILSRKTGKIVALRFFRGVDLLRATFSPDGKHYAVVTGGRIFIDENLQQWDPETRSIVRIHETLTGKTVLAFPAPSRWTRGLKFSPDGKRLAVVTDKGSIEIWNLDL